MSKASIGPILKVDGEKEYRSQMAAVIQQVKTLEAESKKVTATFDDNTTAFEKADKTLGVLQQQVDALNKKEKLLAEMAEKAAEQYGENSSQALKYKELLYNAQEEQIKKTKELDAAILEIDKEYEGWNDAVEGLGNQTEETTKSLENMGDAMEKGAKKGTNLGDQLDTIAGKLGVRIPKEAKEALKNVEGFSAGTAAKMGIAAAAVAATVKTFKELNELTLQAANRADDLLTRNITTGLSTRDLQAFQYASPFIDVDISTLESAFSRMPKVMSQAVEQMNSYKDAFAKANAEGKVFTGTMGAQASAFQQLDISLTDSNGNLRDYHEVVWEALQALGAMGDTTETAAFANEIFGKTYADLKPLMQNAEEAQRLMNEAVAEGYVLSEEQLKILGQVDDANQKLTQTKEKYANMIAVQWSPVNKEAYETLADLMSMAGDALVDSRLIENTAELISNTLKLVDAGATLISKIPSWLNPIKHLADQFQFLNGTLLLTGDLLGVTSKADMKNYGGLGSDIAGATWKDDVQAWVSAGGTIIGDWNYKDFDKSTGKLTRVFDYGSSGDVVSYGKLSEEEIRRLIGHNAAGTEYWKGGGTWVGESGAEYVQLPRGSRIYSNQESRAMLGENNTWNITVANIEELDELVDWYQSRQIRGRMR